MKITNKLIGKICKNQDGREGLVTSIKGDEVRGVGLDGKGNWASSDPMLVKDHYYSVGICGHGKLGIITEDQGDRAVGVGLDGNRWESSSPGGIVSLWGMGYGLGSGEYQWKFLRNLLMNNL